jgi:hypothetical protein
MFSCFCYYDISYWHALLSDALETNNSEIDMFMPKNNNFLYDMLDLFTTSHTPSLTTILVLKKLELNK